MEIIVLLLIYFCIMMVITLITTKGDGSKASFLVGSRSFGTVISALSIAVTWIWAPALFTSAEKAYTNGIPGLFWFLVPNVLCLLFFIPYAGKIRKELPEGFTLSEYMGFKYSKRVKHIYLIELSLLMLFSTTVQLVAGGKILTVLTGFPLFPFTLCLGLIALSYSLMGGLKASVITDALQMSFILITGILIVGAVLKISGITTLFNGLGGISGHYRSITDTKGIEVFLTFGLSSAIGLISGPFGDQCFWQRSFAIKQSKIAPAFALGAFLFAVVPISMAVLGFVAAGQGFTPSNTGTVNLELIINLLPRWVIWPFLFMLVSGLLSTVDSNLCAASSLIYDIKNDAEIKHGRITMIGVTLFAVFVANIPGLTITHLFLFYGTIRASTLFTTVLTLNGVKLAEKGVFYGIIASLTIGLPLFIVGNLLKIPVVQIVGSLAALLLSGTVALKYREPPNE